MSSASTRAPRTGSTKKSAHSSRRRPAPASRSTRLRAAPPPRKWKSRSPGRLVGLFVIFVLLFGGMAARLVVLQVFEGPRFRSLAERQREGVIEFPARRGANFDRNGQSLAVSLDYSMIVTDPAHVENITEASAKLSKILGIPEAEIAPKLAGAVPE